MRIVGKEGNELVLLALKDESVERGDYLLIEDSKTKRKLVTQVYEQEYLSVPSLIHDIVKDEVVKASSRGALHDPLNISNLSMMVRDARLFRCKIRAAIDNGKLTSLVSWLPSRVDSNITKLKLSELDLLVGRGGMFPIELGESSDSSQFRIYAEDLDGNLNVITGKKESGKSHLAKTLIKKLVEHGAFVIVFDLNNEYAGIAWNRDGTPSTINERIIALEPGAGLTFTLDYAGKGAIGNMLKHALDMPAASMREFFRIWDSLNAKNSLGIGRLSNAVTNWDMNELVRDALLSRLYFIQNSKLFTDNYKKSCRFEDIIKQNKNGVTLVVGMGKISPMLRRMTVELVLSKLIELLELGSIPPVFLFAEEAHLYVRETYWEDIITRMRHFGVYTTFITNQPDAIRESIYRQVDNIFLFNFTNDFDLERVSRMSVADTDTIKSIVRTLPQRHCLIIGKAVHDLPVVIKTTQAEVLTLGETKLFFKAKIPVKQNM
ncbi:MAG: ATP-binding protein [Nitrososphaerales archaeon]